MRTHLLALSAAAALFGLACGPSNVNWNLTCVATCEGSDSIGGITANACGDASADPTAVAKANVEACVTSAKAKGCANPVCACEAVRSADACQ